MAGRLSIERLPPGSLADVHEAIREGSASDGYWEQGTSAAEGKAAVQAYSEERTRHAEEASAERHCRHTPATRRPGSLCVTLSRWIRTTLNRKKPE